MRINHNTTRLSQKSFRFAWLNNINEVMNFLPFVDNDTLPTLSYQDAGRHLIKTKRIKTKNIGNKIVTFSNVYYFIIPYISKRKICFLFVENIKRISPTFKYVTDAKTIKWNTVTCCLFVLLLKLVIICFLTLCTIYC